MRNDLRVVSGLVPDGSRVLDLGCGAGELLSHLATRGCRGTGVDTDEEAVLGAIRSGVSVIELDVDHDLGEFADDTYDVVVLSRTLQALHRPADVLTEIRRIGRRCVVSVPNFGLWKHRAFLAVRGRMPVSRALPHEWFDTPNIHLATLPDMEALFARTRWDVEQRVLLDESGSPLRRQAGGNLRAGAAAYLLQR
ncbi:methionine biosynthesis protein MetW [Nocardioides marmoribigeumensis]|jgi:methionine biosynthesis protein MetW|uniref:Methionine biosynthesis protein MetW n=1 Tax=Nocardioides marmoribigeumensis TaxID=433649 RepID=A0ABU2BVX6_9ACTN|nr:methionine biosynthesis protein MetW [Nocardioides marmoribigeumensis]MDR7362792.1 methionine biosynthesis protein MetW [Nocardioides marmoribigeumensis]